MYWIRNDINQEIVYFAQNLKENIRNKLNDELETFYKMR